ncbi:MAG: hypothetical protein Q9215_003384 [Flavoplaca cf. flavocitrina]
MRFQILITLALSTAALASPVNLAARQSVVEDVTGNSVADTAGTVSALSSVQIGALAILTGQTVEQVTAALRGNSGQ